MSKSVLAWQAASAARAPVLPQGGSIVERAPQPVAHVTRQKRLAELLAIGDTIWVVGRYAKLSHASVSLIGRIVIAKKTIKDGAVTFLASRESHWLPWNNASLLLSSMELNSRHGPVFLSPSVGMAQQLQTTREIASGSTELIERFSADLKARPSAFISYNWTATTDILPVLLPALSEAGFAIWVDRWSGPRRIKDGKNFQPADLITKLIADAIVSSDLVVALVSDAYEASRWTSLEGSIARENNKPTVRLPVAEIRRHIQAGTLGPYLAESMPPSRTTPL
ncbi:toll/interleukin-1 receptor domain-containing protein [Rhizobium skierniewicense]|nr:toll/interleukin-1 receptor domain-containing protein [Rhizobium skierniewicense]